jgi:hypothetical protein
MNSSSTTTSTEAKSKLVPRSAYVLELWLFVMAFLAAKWMGWAVVGGVVLVPTLVLATRGLINPPNLRSRRLLDLVPHAMAAVVGVALIGLLAHRIAVTPTRGLIRASSHEPEQQLSSLEFIKILAATYSRSGRYKGTVVFNPDRVASWPVHEIASWISESGVLFSDVNSDGKPTTLTKQLLLNQLSARKGFVHQMFAHVAHVATDSYQPAPRLSTTAAGEVVELGKPTWYRLEFVRDGSGLVLTKCEYLNVQSE